MLSRFFFLSNRKQWPSSLAALHLCTTHLSALSTPSIGGVHCMYCISAHFLFSCLVGISTGPITSIFIIYNPFLSPSSRWRLKNFFQWFSAPNSLVTNILGIHSITSSICYTTVPLMLDLQHQQNPYIGKYKFTIKSTTVPSWPLHPAFLLFSYFSSDHCKQQSRTIRGNWWRTLLTDVS